ncbi:MAG: DNA-binding protein [Gammaproteobacteria bacterium]
MAQAKILLDSNAYFRLAKNIHPLLDTPFGGAHHCLYVLKELDDEFERNKRLKTQFIWVNEDEFVSNRQKRLALSRKDRKAIKLSVDFLRQHKIDNELGVSRVDILCLTYGHVLNIPVVTDDGDMLVLAKDFDIQTMKTLELMRLMHDCDHIKMAKVRQVVGYWKYISDKPAGFKEDYIRLFKEKPT